LNNIFRDREFINTREDYFFCIVGELHPKDRVVSYLRYLPSKQGLWKLNGKNFKRAMPTYSITNLFRNVEFLKENNPDYVFYSNTFGVEMSAVPKNRILNHYIPQSKMQELFESKLRDDLQEKAVELIEYLSDIVEIPINSFGITGSILIDLHNEDFSDIDLIIAGGKNGVKLKKELPHQFKNKKGPLKDVPKPILRKWLQEKMQTHNMSLEEVKKIQGRQWNYGSFMGTVFSIHTVRDLSEINEEYGDRHFHPVGIIAGQGVIDQDSESLFNPHNYGVKDFEVTEGMKVEDVTEVVTYSGLYGGIYSKNEEILVHGKLEYVEDNKHNRSYHRVLVGSPESGGHDYIKPK
jgi:predicted nucleotidyltransferase